MPLRSRDGRSSPDAPPAARGPRSQPPYRCDGGCSPVSARCGFRGDASARAWITSSEDPDPEGRALPTSETNAGPRPATADSRFANLTYEDFRKLALDPSLSCHEKVGFPDSYRQGKEEAIFQDVLGKLARLRGRGKRVLDVGPGCSRLAFLLIEQCER